MFKTTVSLLLILSSCIIYSQTEYKISAEGFTFDKPVGNTVKLNIYLSVSNVGSLEQFNGQIRNIKLTTKDKSRYFTLIDFNKVMDNRENVTDFAIFLLSYNIPVDASDITLSLPEIYGGLTIPISSNSYQQIVNKGNNSEGTSNNSSSKTPKGVIDNTIKYVGITISLDLGLNYKGNSIPSLGFDISVIPKLIRFGKNEKYSLGINLNYTRCFFLSKTKSDFSKYYSLNENDVIFASKDTSVDQSFYGGGPAFTVKFGKASALFAVNYGGFLHQTHSITLVDNGQSLIYHNPSFSTSAFKLDAGFSFANSFFLGYSFIYTKYSAKENFFSGVYRVHLFKIGIGGF